MNPASIKAVFSNLSAHQVATVVVVLIGVVLLLLAIKAGKVLTKLLFFLIAIALFAGAYWWHTHK